MLLRTCDGLKESAFDLAIIRVRSIFSTAEALVSLALKDHQTCKQAPVKSYLRVRCSTRRERSKG